MQAKQFFLTPDTLRRFVPFDELAPETRAKLVSQTEILEIPPGEEIRDAFLDSRYTLYLLEGELGLMAGERLVDTQRGTSPISRFPLSRLRSGQIRAKTHTPVCLLRIRRELVSQLISTAADAEDPLQRNARVAYGHRAESCGTLAAMETIVPPQSENAAEPKPLNPELAAAESEIESAVRDKAEATIARRLWASGFHGLEGSVEQAESRSLENQLARLLADQARLEERSHAASEALTKAHHKKLQLEAALRSSNTRHAQEQSIHRRLRDPIENPVSNEEQRLEADYRRISTQLAQLEEARRAAEQRLETERKQLAEKYATARKRLQKQAADIQASLSAVREQAPERADAPYPALPTAREHVHIEAEARLRKERMRLEAELRQSERALRAAQQELEAAQASHRAIEHEARQLSMRLQDPQTATAGQTSGLALPGPDATSRPRQPNEPTERRHQPVQMPSAPCHESGHQSPGEKTGSPTQADDIEETLEESLRAELEAIEHKLAHADSRLTAATQAEKQAVNVKYRVEEQVARHRAVEGELRLEICQGTEHRHREEYQRSMEEATAARTLVEAMGADTLAAATSESHADPHQVMIADIQLQLEQGSVSSPVTPNLRDKTTAEHQASRARSAQQKAEEERVKAKLNLQRARKHLIDVRTQMEKNHSSNPD